MSSLALIIDSHTLTLIEKGKPALEKHFNFEESFSDMIDKMISHKFLSRVQFFFTGNHLVSETIITHHTSEIPFSADKRAFDHLMSRIEFDFLAKYNQNKEYKLIVTAPLTLYLNGYHVPSPLNQKVTDLRITAFLSAIPTSFTKQKGEFYSFPFYLAEKIHLKYMKDSFIVCSSGGETIDISIKKEGDLFKTQSVSIDSQVENNIKKILNDCFGGVSLPGDVFVVVPQEVFSIIEKVFADGTYHSSCMTTRGFTLQRLDVTSLIEV